VSNVFLMHLLIYFYFFMEARGLLLAAHGLNFFFFFFFFYRGLLPAGCSTWVVVHIKLGGKSLWFVGALVLLGEPMSTKHFEGP
jgi:hypothetical protein